MNTSLFERFRKVTSVTVIIAIVFSTISPVAFAATSVNSVTVGSQVGTLTAGIVGSATFLVTIDSNGSGGLVVTPSISGLPAGTSASFAPATVTVNNNSQQTTLTITTTLAATAGSSIITVGNDDSSDTGTATLTIVSGDTTAPTISNITSTTANNTYGVGTVIPLDVTFSEIVTSTGDVTLTTDTGRTCTFTVTSSTTGSCNYTVQAGDNSSDLNVATVSGTIKDVANNPMVVFSPSTNLADNKAIVIDTTAPSVPTNTLPNGTFVNTDNFDFTWDVSTDNAPGSLTYEYQASQDSTVDGFGVLTNGVWSSGTLLTNLINSTGAAQGVWYWQVRAKDVAGNYSAWSPVASVTKDTIAPVISADGSFLAVGPVTASGAVITYTTVPTATDVGTPSPLVTCLPVSGTNFPLNSTATITCNSTDNAGNTGVQTFNIIIEDEEDPALLLPGDISVESVAPASATATFTVSATDNVDTFGAPVTSGSAPAIICNHLSGETYSFGTTLVTCTATDSEGNDTTDDFNVVVEDTIEPTVVITLDDSALNVGDTALVTFTFSEAPVGFDNADVTVENGTIDTVAGSGTVYTATFTPTAGIEDTTNKITVGTDWTDANTPSGNAPLASADSPNYEIDTLAPTLSNINSAISFPPGANITWTTNEVATTYVEYGLTDSYGSSTTLDPTLTTSHTALITGLQQVTTYHFRVISVDSEGNVATSGDNVFTTSGAVGGSVPSDAGVGSATPASATPPVNNSVPEPTPTQPTPENIVEPTPTPESTPVAPNETTPENPSTPTENTSTPEPTPTPTVPTGGGNTTGNTTGGTGTGNTGTGGQGFNPADATLDEGGGTTPEETETVVEAPTLETTTDVGGGNAVEEGTSYTLLWTLLGLIALLNTWWFFVAKNKPTIIRRD